MSRVEIEPVDRVEITILMDNVTDPLLVDQDAVTRINWPKALMGALPVAPARVSPESGVPDSLIAEPGFSALVRIEKAGRQRTLLFDTGVSPGGMVENMRRLGIAPGNVEVIVLSHGHCDHVTGMEGLVRALGRTHLPVMIHPEFWNRRRVRFPGLEPAELPSTSRSALDEMGFAIVEERQPSFLLDGARQEWRSTVTPVTSSLVSAKTTTRRAAPRECRNHMRAALSTIGGKSAAPAWKDASPPSRRLLLRWTREAAAGRP